MKRLFALLLSCCPHTNTSWPIGGTQRCFTCGRIRTYTIGEQPGAWHVEPVPATTKAA